MKKFLLIIPFLLSSCIGEDIVFDEIEPEIRITNPLISLEISTNFQFEFTMINNVGEEIQPTMTSWSSSDESKMTIDNNGLATALDYGTVTATVTASYETITVMGVLTFNISDETVMQDDIRSGTVSTTSSYDLTGDFELRVNGNDLILEFYSDYVADTSLPGLYVYLSNNSNSSAAALEIAAVTTFSGAHSYTIPNTGLYDYQYVLYFCKPFNVKVGHGVIMDPL